jgi:hypothetical protein
MPLWGAATSTVPAAIIVSSPTDSSALTAAGSASAVVHYEARSSYFYTFKLDLKYKSVLTILLSSDKIMVKSIGSSTYVLKLDFLFIY